MFPLLFLTVSTFLFMHVLIYNLGGSLCKNKTKESKKIYIKFPKLYLR